VKTINGTLEVMKRNFMEETLGKYIRQIYGKKMQTDGHLHRKLTCNFASKIFDIVFA
jgi:hypothetical protein